MQIDPPQNHPVAWMSPDMFVLGHHVHTCGILSISPPIPIEETPMEIHSVSTCRMNERLCAAPVLNEKKKRDPEEGLGTAVDLWFRAMELFSQKHKCIQCCPIYNL